MGKIIDISKFIKASGEIVEMSLCLEGCDVFTKLSVDDATAITQMFASIADLETKVHFGTSSLSDYDLENYGQSIIFDTVKSQIKESTNGCYFCDLDLDPNETQFTNETVICPACQFKMANFLKFLGVKPEKVLALVAGDRKVQTEKIKLKVRF